MTERREDDPIARLADGLLRGETVEALAGAGMNRLKMLAECIQLILEFEALEIDPRGLLLAGLRTEIGFRRFRLAKTGKPVGAMVSWSSLDRRSVIPLLARRAPPGESDIELVCEFIREKSHQRKGAPAPRPFRSSGVRDVLRTDDERSVFPNPFLAAEVGHLLALPEFRSLIGKALNKEKGRPKEPDGDFDIYDELHTVLKQSAAETLEGKERLGIIEGSTLRKHPAVKKYASAKALPDLYRLRLQGKNEIRRALGLKPRAPFVRDLADHLAISRGLRGIPLARAAELWAFSFITDRDSWNLGDDDDTWPKVAIRARLAEAKKFVQASRQKRSDRRKDRS